MWQKRLPVDDRSLKFVSHTISRWLDGYCYCYIIWLESRTGKKQVLEPDPLENIENQNIFGTHIKIFWTRTLSEPLFFCLIVLNIYRLTIVSTYDLPCTVIFSTFNNIHLILMHYNQCINLIKH